MAREHGELARGHPLAGIGQPIGIGECRFFQAELARAFGQLVAELALVAGERLGEDDAGVVGRLDDHAVQQVVDADPAVQLGEHGGAARRRAAVTPGVFADLVFVGELDLALLDLMEDVFRRHQLGEAGRRDQRVGLVLVEHAAVLGDQDGVRGADAGRVILAGGRSRPAHADGQQRRGQDRDDQPTNLKRHLAHGQRPI